MQYTITNIKTRLVFLMLCIAFKTYSQNNQTFNIISQFEPNVKNGVKANLSPEVPDSTPAAIPLQFGILPNPKIQYVQPEPIAAATLKARPDRQASKALVNVALAPIYVMPLLQVNYASKPTRSGLFGFQASHYSADFNTKKELPQSFATSKIVAYNIYHVKNLTLNSDLIYKRHVNRYFDVTDIFTQTVLKDDQKSSIRQQLQIVSPQVIIQTHNTDSFKLNYTTLANYYLVQRDFTGSTEWEQSYNVKTTANRWINREHVFADINLMYLKYTFQDSVMQNSLGTLNPYFKTRGPLWQSRVGFKLAYSKSLNQSGLTYVYPDLQASYDVFPGWAALHLNVTGDLQRNSMYTLYTNNPFVSNALTLKNTTIPILTSITLNGKTWIKSQYELSASWTQLKNAPVFNRMLSNERWLFNPNYCNYAALTIMGYWNHQLNDRFNYNIKGEWYKYFTDSLVQLQNLPDYSINANMLYAHSTKLHLSCGIFIFGTQQFINYESQQPALKPWTDINLGAEYQHSAILKYYVKIHNMINQNTYRWDGYRQQNFNIVFGVSFNPLKS